MLFKKKNESKNMELEFYIEELLKSCKSNERLIKSVDCRYNSCLSCISLFDYV